MTNVTAQGVVRPLVVGLGSDHRGDDAIGPIVARCIADLQLRGIRVVEQEDPTALIDLWWDHDPVVVIDAVHSGGRFGRVRTLETGCATPTVLPARSSAGMYTDGIRTFGLATVVELCRALGRLPRRLVLVGIEAVRREDGVPMSPAVAAAVPLAVEAVIGALWETGVPTEVDP